MKEFDRLVAIMKRLRHPQKGCPWDLEQTPESLKEYILEETHELLEAIDKKSAKKVREELGDLLLQIVFLAQIQEESGRFKISEMVDHINRKLIQRHPHIFENRPLGSASEVRKNWEKIKMKEKKKKSILSQYPDHMPALLVAKRITSQASTVGFDWNHAASALDKVEEEIAELKKEIHTRKKRQAEEEMGDLLFAVANVARLLGINPEFALKKTNRKFSRRFQYIEKSLRARGHDIQAATLSEMEDIWQKSKKSR